jgi:hypothetical protein
LAIGFTCSDHRQPGWNVARPPLAVEIDQFELSASVFEGADFFGIVEVLSDQSGHGSSLSLL